MPYGNMTDGLKFYNNYHFAYSKGNIDIYKDNIKLGFSYYRLINDYTGYCLRVRRGSDSAEKDIGFINNYIDYNDIASFCNGTTGYITIWYNQVSGNNAVQVSASNQPIIYSSGTFESNGLKFITADTRYLELAVYEAIDFTVAPVSIYFNYVLDTGTGCLLYKNNTTYVQFGLLALSTMNFRIDTSAGTNATAHTLLPVGTNGKNLYIWRDKNADGVIGNQNGTILTSTKNTDITSGALIDIGIRYVTGYSLPFNGNIKTFIMLDNVAEYSIISRV